MLPAAISDGIYPVFGDTADVKFPMVATADVGAAVAELLLSPPATSQVIDLDALSYSEQDVATGLGVALRRAVQVVTIPRAGWFDALTGAGVPPMLATELVDMYNAGQRGDLHPRGDRSHRCATPLDETLRRLVANHSHDPLSQPPGRAPAAPVSH